MPRKVLIAALTLGLTLCASLAFTACGGDDDNPDDIDVESEGIGSDENTKDYTIIATDFGYSSDHLDIESGTIIFELDNQGETAHTLSLYRDEAYTDLADTTGNVNPGVNRETEMALDPGEYFVRCDIHPTQMEMTMTATEPVSS